MTDRQKTTIQPSVRVHALARKISLISGMSVTGVYAVGILGLAARHFRVLELGSKRREFLTQIRDALLEEVKKVEDLMK